ncbi:hypothetical protein [Bradyrhizobium sp. ORS 375]|uniref:hypothetical protein n=1 Tax=Bradyrhizobium sp. (strain ORS 375) TaxID=566679 RepID=UPI001111F6C5|nr:hypothetical protein [Bradyrhizobium sp. ORS 375]
MSVFNATTPVLLPYEGRPLIYRVVVNYLKRFGGEVVVAVREGETRVEEFLRAAFGGRVDLFITRVASAETASPTDTLKSALQDYSSKRPHDGAVLIVHGDIYFEDIAEALPREPTAYVAPFIESDKYSYFRVDGDGVTHCNLSRDEVTDAGEPELKTDIGAYWAPSIATLKAALTSSDKPSTVGGLFARTFPALKLCDQVVWCDLGHLDTATQIRTRLMGTREFNSLTIDERRGLLTKKSTRNTKLMQEINYYAQLPRPLSIYFPRMHEFSIGNSISYSMEFYSYRTLSEYLVFFDLPERIWHRVLQSVLEIRKEFTAYAGETVSLNDHVQFYIGKLNARMGQLDPESRIHEIVSREAVIVNGQERRGWRAYLSEIEEIIVEMGADYRATVVHGDLCFSNILYDPQTSILKLIDPRGEFFREGCFGDPRYDLAKLLHSFHGGYDYIVHEMYELSVEPCNIAFTRFQSRQSAQLGQSLLAWVAQKVEYPIRDLLVLEAMLFLSMLPLHGDDEKRQIALYLTGIEILNEVLPCGSASIWTGPSASSEHLAHPTARSGHFQASLLS